MSQTWFVRVIVPGIGLFMITTQAHKEIPIVDGSEPSSVIIDHPVQKASMVYISPCKGIESNVDAAHDAVRPCTSSSPISSFDALDLL